MGERMPLCVMLEVMRIRMKTLDYDGAVAVAKAAAPYVHGRVLAARVGGGLAGVPDDELEEYGRAGGDSAEAEDPEAVG